MVFRYDGRTATVATVADAVRVWEAYRDSTGGGCSDIGNGGSVRRGNKVVATISYNGRIWPAEGK